MLAHTAIRVTHLQLLLVLGNALPVHAEPGPASAPVPAPAPTATTLPTPAAPVEDGAAPEPPPEATPPAESVASATPPPSPPPEAPAPPRSESARDPRTAVVHLSSSYAGAVLELKSLESHTWAPACVMPCDRALPVLGSQARVSAPGMTTSNVFRIEPGPGVAVMRVEGGSALLRTLGITGLAIGVPLGLVGTGMYSYGRFEEDDGLAVAGGIVLGTGAVALLAALPLLMMGSTDVRDARGSMIAAGPAPRATP